MPFNLGPMELILLLLAIGFGIVVFRFVGRRLLRGPRDAEQLEDLQDKVELLEYKLEEERQRRDQLPG